MSPTGSQKKSIKVSTPAKPDNPVYHVTYSYDNAGRLQYVNEPLLDATDNYIAGFEYDDNGNRDKLHYYRAGSLAGNKTTIDYTYNLDNRLTAYSTASGPTFSLSNVTIDGLGRLVEGDDTVTDTGGSSTTHSLDYQYDMLSELTSASVSNIGGGTWTASYEYKKDGNISSQTVNSVNTSFSYDGDLMTDKGNDSLDWDLNGCLESGINKTMTYNWDNKLRSATAGDVVNIKYDPSGNRVWRQVLDGQTTTRKYILDSTGRLPVILLEIDADINDANEPVKTYIYAHSQILAQHDGKYDDNIYFYLHDRLGSVRQVIDTSANVKDNYTYQPFGDDFTSELEEQVTNNFKFTGQWYDSEISQYYLRARDYYPAIYRFTSRDPVKGRFTEPLTLHVYLYCINNPVNRTDITGQMSLPEVTGGTTLQSWLSSKIVSGILGGAFRGGIRGGVAYCMGDADWVQALGSVGVGAASGGLGGWISGLSSFSAAGYLGMFVESAGNAVGWDNVVMKEEVDFAKIVTYVISDSIIGTAFYGIGKNHADFANTVIHRQS